MQSSIRGLALCGALGALALGSVAFDVAQASETHDRSSFAPTIRAEADKAGLPFDIADAVMAIESGYDPTRIGGVGEIGLMQLRPATAAMLGFKGSLADLAKPEVNIHFGVTYLAQAWKRANGNVCRALMKYRAGHGEEAMTPLSVTYCERAKIHLAAVGSTFARGLVVPVSTTGLLARVTRPSEPSGRALIGMSSEAFWALHSARIRRLDAQVQRRWSRIATR